VATVGIVGLGPVGLATGVAFAAAGHRVVGFDIDRGRRERIARGESPFYEQGLAAALRKALRSKRFAVTEEIRTTVAPSGFVFLSVGTPSRPDGSMEDSALREAVRSVAKVSAGGNRRTVVVKSTVVPGTAETVVRPILEEAGMPFRLAVNPEFLREGRALEDALRPDRIVIGSDGPATGKAVRALFRGARCPILLTDLRTAEAIKYATNAFLATKVAFANEVANLCDALGVSYDEVHRGIALDPRINPKFLVPGVGFGGSCFPKDVRALIAAGRARGVDAGLLRSVLEQNEVQHRRAIELLEEELGDLRGRRIALLGLAFKGGTDDIRESRAVPIAMALLEKGATVVGYDPAAAASFAKAVPKVDIAGSVRDALTGADGCVIQADWPEFSRLTSNTFRSTMTSPVVVDGRRVLNPTRLQGVRFRRIG
jgi:UDPglucose 6-dehydrogenase